jgi:ATP-binding cassette, subfamily B, bacterial
MKKTLWYGWKVLYIYYKANGKSAIIDIGNRFYESTFYPLIEIFLLARLLDILVKNHHLSFSAISPLLIYYLLATVWKYILRSLAIVRGPGYEYAINDYIEIQINKKLYSLDPAVFENSKFQNLLAQMNGVKGSLATYLVRMVAFISDVVQFVTAAVVVSTSFPIFIPLIVVATIPGFLVMSKMRVTMFPYWSYERGILERLFQYVRNTFSNPSTAKEVAIFNNGSMLLHKVKHAQSSYYRRFEKAYYKSLFTMIIAGLVQVAIFAYTQALNLAAVFAGKLSIGQFTLFFQQTFTLAFSAEGMLDDFSSMSMRTKYISQYFEFLSYPNSVRVPDKPKELPNHSQNLEVRFQNVSFRYPETTKYILKDFNLIIKSGERIALVGENGAGKSTIIKLLLRFYDVTEGEITINGINIKELDLPLWHKQIGALFQDFIKYQFTFKENVTFGSLEKQNDISAVHEAIRKSGALDYFKELPKGFEQIVGKTFENGIDLSGGQWQKLALARAFFRDAPVLILDEPTSAIDAKAEYEIFERVEQLQKDKMVIIISHRFSTVRNADRILVLDNGKIIEEGSHEELMKKKGLYEELFTLQAKGYQ